jgi:membrane protein YdbS with pleckstrin-like domain
MMMDPIEGGGVKEISVTPDRGQRTVWLIHWTLWFVPILVGLLILMVINSLVFGLCALGWVLLMIPLAVWLPAYFHSLDYALANDAVKGRRGVLFKRSVTMPYHKITNVDITHGPLQRKYGVGYLHCQTAGAGGQQGARAELKMEGIKDLEGVKDLIMERIKGLSAVQAGTVAHQAAEAPGSASVAGGANFQEQMLAELRAIREAVEKRSGS